MPRCINEAILAGTCLRAALGGVSFPMFLTGHSSAQGMSPFHGCSSLFVTAGVWPLAQQTVSRDFYMWGTPADDEGDSAIVYGFMLKFVCFCGTIYPYILYIQVCVYVCECVCMCVYLRHRLSHFLTELCKQYKRFTPSWGLVINGIKMKSLPLSSPNLLTERVTLFRRL